MSKSADRAYDLVVFGATSFVGQILTRYLFDTYKIGKSVKWAIAGRSAEKLAALKESLGGKATELPVVLADAADGKALQSMCEQARVVVSTVGPYALYGEALVRECVRTGTDYCDLTGEVQWIRKMVDSYEDEAKASGARIVHCCGFDSIPSDMGVWFLQGEAEKLFGMPCRDVRMRVKVAKGAFSGGTVASMINIAKEVGANPELRRELANPFSICPPDDRPKARQPNLKSAEFDKTFNVWLAPFVMGAINTRIVHRSNALQNARYGRDFTYDEAMMTGSGIKGRLAAYGVIGGLGAFLAGSAIKPTRWIIEKLVPKPGEGPSPEAQEAGFYDLRFVGRTADGKTMITKVTGDKDPGYGSTGKMLGEAAMCLAFDVPADHPGGFWTPSSLLGASLMDRLTSKAGLTFDVLETR
ncbi:MAG TPA: saccharopine dehydrogenase NADP-binding domain-containing protein [Marinobacter sp.]|nr:saccharopine dehydrogenase NADP-binding domain-containing protein [Marinobacter sp.]